MRLLTSFIMAVAFVSLSLAFVGHSVGATNTRAQEEQPGDGVRRISPSDARAAFDSGRAVIVDVRSLDTYRSEHVKGALSIPIDELESRLNELPRNKMIITYCS